MRAWIDRTNDGLSGMPADGISLPPKRGDLGTSRWGGLRVRLHQPRDRAEGGMIAWGTKQARAYATACPQLAKADVRALTRGSGHAGDIAARPVEVGDGGGLKFEVCSPPGR
jgi:hypothetical protein